MSTDSAPTTEAAAEEPAAGPSRRLIAAGAVAAALVLYAGAAWALSSRVPYGSTVAGVPLGGQTRNAAVDRLSAAADQLGGSLPVTVDGRSARLDLASAGLSVDAEATVDPLVGFGLDPVSLLRHLTGGGEHPVRPEADSGRLMAALQGIAGAVATPAQDAAIRYVDGAPVLTPAQPGRELDPAAAVTVVENSWLAGTRPVTLPTDTVQPEITQPEGRAALTELAQPAVSGP